jgi:hypothetical protein
LVLVIFIVLGIAAVKRFHLTGSPIARVGRLAG